MLQEYARRRPRALRPAEKGEKDEDGKGDNPDGGDTPKEDPFGKIEPFPVESINSIEDGVGQSVAVMKALRDDNKKLAELYQAKAQLSAALSVCQAIRIQGQNFGISINAVSQTLTAVADDFDELASGYSALGAAFQGVTDNSPDYYDLIQKIKNADSDWSSISNDVAQFERTFAGIGNLFPPAA